MKNTLIEEGGGEGFTKLKATEWLALQYNTVANAKIVQEIKCALSQV